ncbi:nicotinamide-nucleotide adenylyltransferase NadR [Butyrivibrio proteoclasticus B316]|uniref:Nicotinamide-nucleotide adenylyltransferase NadR n=1 Tax=Butyrivibrio proteoclasticus (strain ATCC 51982 / DSM 14932 / B316) TaxID=515622 RepID=E0S2U4_BUTPB|nr:AAA family ATPase [Butyrivibrio proteoclasticus]ADL35726.1 nicotinamide-nucleotide adenylyltransferase NadR [Butyrivibrio proteoclasticus B316]
MYKIGMYGGTFNPMHNGHLECIIKAACMCEKLYIVLSIGNNRDEVDYRVRYRWLYQATKHIGNVEIFTISDDCETKQEYTLEASKADSEYVKKHIGEPIDVVFCGSDYDADSFWNVNYPDSEFYVFERNDISSTAIREDLYGHWDWLPTFVRPYYVKKVLLIGVESSGKSIMTVNLANYYNTNYIEEAGRDLSEKSGTDTLMLDEDFTEILLTQKLNEMKTVEQSNRVLFCDTDCLITQFFLKFLGGNEENIKLSDAIDALNSYDLVLFLAPDVKWVQDGDRSTEIRDNRDKYRKMIADIYESHGKKFEYIEGDYLTKFNRCVELVDKMLAPQK